MSHFLLIFATLFHEVKLQFIKKSVFVFLITIFIWNCSGSVDTTKFNAEEYFNYAMELYNQEDYEKAVLEFQNIILQYSGTTFNDDAQFYLGMTYYKREQYLLAAYEFSKLIRNTPASEFVPSSQYMLAESYYQLSPPYQLDQTYTKKSIEEFQAFVDFFPADPKVEEAEGKIKAMTEKLAEKEYQSAVIYEKMDYSKAAIKYYGLVADSYHDTKFAPMALYDKIKLQLSKGYINDVLADISVFLSRYPDNSVSKELQQIEVSLLNKN